MQQRTSDIAWLITEAAALGRCARQAWAMVPGWPRTALAAAAVLMAINSFSFTLQALLLGSLVNVLDRGLDGGSGAAVPRDQLLRSSMILLGVIAGLYVMRECFNVARRYMVESTCTGLNRDMQLRVVSHIMRYDMQQFAGEKLGALHGKIFRSVDGLIHFVRLMFLDFLPAILTGAFALTTAVLKEPRVGLVMVGVVPLSVFLTLRQLKTQKGVRLLLMRDCEAVDGMVVEQLSGVEYIRVADTADREMARLGEVTERRRGRELKHHFEMSLFGSGKALNEGVFHVAVLGLAIYLTIQGTLELGDIAAFSALFLSVMSPLNEIHRVVDLGHESSLRMYDLQELLQRPTDRSFAAAPAPALATTAAGGLPTSDPIISVEELSAEYALGDRRWRPVLHGISFDIRPGECVGIAGPSGGGKSSMVKILLRLLHPTGGRASVCGVDIDSLDRRSIAEYIGYVGQNPFVFAGTVGENIAYGCDGADRLAIERAAKAAHIHDEILQMDGGYDAAVSERGNNLSGGQRQRIAIARLLLRSTPILILDEATSALDNISERFIQSAIGIRSGKQTVLMIAHRLTTLRHCDKILVFDQGRIVESGIYRDLSVGDGKFAELLRASESEVHSETTNPDVAELA